LMHTLLFNLLYSTLYTHVSHF